jgi:hypothetical protein
MIELKKPVTLNTDGRGLWSDCARQVSVTALSLPYVADDNDFGELRIHFDTDTWNLDEHGLIYTDKQFERELKKFLNGIGLAGSDVDYSEQGMQGDDYVSCDVGGKFISSWNKKFTITI